MDNQQNDNPAADPQSVPTTPVEPAQPPAEPTGQPEAPVTEETPVISGEPTSGGEDTSGQQSAGTPGDTCSNCGNPTQNCVCPPSATAA